MTAFRFATSLGVQIGELAFAPDDPRQPTVWEPGYRNPSVLVSYHYIGTWTRHQHKYVYRDWVMDSGAFSAHNAGARIDLGEYIEFCKERLATDPTLTEIFALDVVGDWRAGLRNTERMWADGIRCIPTYHVGEPVDALLELAKCYPKIALGGAVRYAGRNAWAEQCFARVWPKRIHGLGFGEEKILMRLPFHSADCSTWATQPQGYGNWRYMGNASGRGVSKLRSRKVEGGPPMNLRAEIEWHLRMEERVMARWKSEMALLETLP